MSMTIKYWLFSNVAWHPTVLALRETLDIS